VLRVTIHGRRREMGLGGLTDVSLAAAREAAERWRAVAASGHDPIKEREREARELSRADSSLRVVALEAFEARKAELKGDGKAGRWFTPLELHVLPKIGKVPVQDIDQRDIRDTLAPIWHTKADTPLQNRQNPIELTLTPFCQQTGAACYSFGPNSISVTVAVTLPVFHSDGTLLAE